MHRERASWTFCLHCEAHHPENALMFSDPYAGQPLKVQERNHSLFSSFKGGLAK